MYFSVFLVVNTALVLGLLLLRLLLMMLAGNCIGMRVEQRRDRTGKRDRETTWTSENGNDRNVVSQMEGAMRSTVRRKRKELTS